MRTRHPIRKAILICLVILIVVAGACLALLSLSGIRVDRGAAEARRQIGRVIARNFGDSIADIPRVEKGYYYEQLEEDGQAIYRALYAGVTADQTEIEVPGRDLALIEDVWNCLMADHQEFFWLTGGIESTSYDPPVGKSYSHVRPDWTCQAEELTGRRQEVEAVVAAYFSDQEEGGSDYDKIKAAYDYIVETTDYDDDAPDDQNLYSALVGKHSVCAGYSKAFQYLLKRQGIECLYVTGINEENGEGHGWNIVRCGDNYYQVDVTWGDPVYADPETSLPEELRIIGYDYFCCTDEEIMQTHSLDEGLKAPACTAADLNYYKKAGCFYDSVDIDYLREIIIRDVDAGKRQSIFKFASHDLYEQAHGALTGSLLTAGANRIIANRGLSRSYNYYEEEPGLNKVIIYWQYE